MNLDNIQSGWQQFKVISSFPDIQEEEILSIIEAKHNKPSWQLVRKMAHNTLIYVFLLICVNGSCVG